MGRKSGLALPDWDFEPLVVDEPACDASMVDLFFPEAEIKDDSSGRKRRPRANYEEARAVCATCPERTPCLDYALRHRIDFGMWGGKTPRERREIRSEERRRADAVQLRG